MSSKTIILDTYYKYTVETEDYVRYFKFINENRNLSTEHALKLLEIPFEKERIDD
jgi:hypothetical protein